MNPPAEFFEHSALADPRSQIRLLSVQPGDDDSDVSCQLQAYEFKQVPSYQAVSYIWGDPNELRSIVLNGKRLIVRYNCCDVLRQIRKYCLDDDSRQLFWLDAICINQTDVIEKSAQVQMMGEIFESAAYVLVCPGPSSDTISFLLNQVAHVKTIIDKLATERPIESTMRADLCKDAVREWINLLDGRELVQITKSIFELELRQYWTRAWVVQELYLAEDRLLLCGSSAIQILTVAEVTKQFILSKTPIGKGQQELRRMQPDLDRLSEMAGLEHGALYRLTMEDSTMRRMIVPTGPTNFSKTSLDWVHQLGCSDTRDRIFAMRRLLEWSTDTGPPSTDYTKTSFEVAVDAVMRVATNSMHHTTGLDLIASMLKIMDISIHGLQQYFPTGLTVGALNAIMWRSEGSLPHLSTCIQCKSEKRTYKLKVPIWYWTPIGRNGQGYLTIATNDTIVPANDPAVEAFFSAVKVESDHAHGPNLGTHLSHAGLASSSTSESLEHKGTFCPASCLMSRQLEQPDSKSLSRPTESCKETDAVQLPHAKDGISPLILSSQARSDRPQQLLGMVKSSTRPGDLVVEVFEDRQNKRQHSCRHLILRDIGDGFYEISGHAFLPSNIYRASYPGSRLLEWHEKTVLRMSIDIEDAIAYFLETNKPSDLVQQINRSFCLRSGSSFGKTRPMSDSELDRQRRPYMSSVWTSHEPASEKMYDFCLKCGRDLNSGEVE